MNEQRIKRLVTPEPTGANQHCIVGTGLSFQGVQVALIVPASAPMPPGEYVKSFVADFHRMWRRSKMVTLRDCYEATIKNLSEN
jgi:hypothetical protein